jgi:hypothetical protein
MLKGKIISRVVIRPGAQATSKLPISLGVDASTTKIVSERLLYVTQGHGDPNFPNAKELRDFYISETSKPGCTACHISGVVSKIRTQLIEQIKNEIVQNSQS